MYVQWRKRWNVWHGRMARYAFKHDDWEAILLLAKDHGIKTILEFGSGLSTILFSAVFDRVVSYETDERFMSQVAKHCTPRAEFHHWANQANEFKGGAFDLALVDGVMPREPQADAARLAARFIAVHDAAGCGRRAVRTLEDLEEVNAISPYMRIFKGPRCSLAS